MAQSGKWMENLINWLIGYVFFYVWQILGQIFGLFGLWETPHVAMMEIYENFPMPDVTMSLVTDNMAVGGQ